MRPENFEFEKEGIKIDHERALTYSKLRCPFDCKYCFAEDINLEQTKNISYLSEKQLELLEQLPEEITLVMLGCDTEFFQSKESLEILEKVSNLNKDISVVTRSPLSQDYIEKLKQINDKIIQNENFFAFSMSLPCLDSAKEWEPISPNPYKRIDTLRAVYEAKIKTLAAIRPLLPTLSEDELQKIITLTKDYCDGYYSGPLYLKDLNNELLDKETFQNLKIEKLQPHWMPEGNIFYKIERPEQMELLSDILRKYDKPLFEGAAETIKYLKIHKNDIQ